MAEQGRDRCEVLAEMCRRFGIELLYVFGSRAREVQEWAAGRREALAPGPSDVDIGAKERPGARRLGGFEKAQLAVELEDRLGVSRVDLVFLDEADAFLAANIIRGERLYAEDAYRADEYELYVLARAGDLAPFERERLRMILEQKG